MKRYPPRCESAEGDFCLRGAKDVAPYKIVCTLAWDVEGAVPYGCCFFRCLWIIIFNRTTANHSNIVIPCRDRRPRRSENERLSRTTAGDHWSPLRKNKKFGGRGRRPRRPVNKRLSQTTPPLQAIIISPVGEGFPLPKTSGYRKQRRATTGRPYGKIKIWR